MNFAALQQLALAARGLCFDAEFSRTRRLTLSGAVMSTLIPQQLVNAQSAGVQQVFAFATKAFDGIEKLVALNLQVVKATLAENQEIMTKAVSAKPEELFALSTSLVQPAAEKVASYSRHVYEILSAMQGELSSATQAQFQQYQRDAQGLVENLAKHAPLGSETAVTAWKSAIATASAASEPANKATKEAA
jgi:phasin family protein